MQTLDIYRASMPGKNEQSKELLPVVLYLHGGGWAFGDKSDVHLKPQFFTKAGFAFVSMNYRLRWDFKVYDQLVDIVSAISWLQKNGREYGLDADRIILMGHAAGGHLATLVMTDASYFRAEGVNPTGVKVVVAIDSASFDIMRLMKELGSFIERRQHELIFTKDETVWQAASPISHVTESDVTPAYALLFNPNSDSSTLQAKGFAKSLTAVGTTVVMIPGDPEKSDQTDDLIGGPDNVATGALMAFLRSQM